MHTRRRFATPSMLCGLSFLRLFLTPLDILYGASDETRSLFCALPHGHSVAKARGGFGKRLVRLLIPLCFWPVGGHGRSRRATFPLCCGLQWIVRIGCAGLCLGSSVRCHGRGRAPGVRFGPAALPAAHRQPALQGLTGLSVPAPNFGLFWESVPSCKGVPCRKKGPGLVGGPIEDVEGGQKEAEK